MVRRAAHGCFVHLRALLETGNSCRADCLYCGLRRGNSSIERYSLEAHTIVDIVSRAASGGFRTVVMQSGEDAGRGPEFIRDVVVSIRDCVEAALTLSYGEWPAAVYGMWRRAGADRYLLKFETSNRELFAFLRPGRTLDQRLACLRFLREAGFQVGTGFMVGLPGQTLDDIANDLLLLHHLDPDMAGIGPYIPHPATPLAQSCREWNCAIRSEDSVLGNFCSAEMTLRCLAIARIMNPSLHLPATTALETSLADGHLRGLSAGANVLMVNVTPGFCSRNYDLYPGRHVGNDEDPRVLWNRYEGLLAREGYMVSPDRGDGKGNGASWE